YAILLRLLLLAHLPPTPSPYTLSLHDALPIWLTSSALPFPTQKTGSGFGRFCKTRSTVSAPAVLASSSSSSSDSSLSMPTSTARSEEHTSELQSRFDLVCRLLLEKKKCSPLMK